MLKRDSINVHSHTWPLVKSREPTGRIGFFFWNFLNGFAKRQRLIVLNIDGVQLFWKTVKYCILSEVCMINTAPHSTVSPQMWCIKSIKGWFTHLQICSQKIQPDLFSRPNLLWSRAVMALECDRRWLLFFWWTYKSTWCGMSHSKIT